MFKTNMIINQHVFFGYKDDADSWVLRLFLPDLPEEIAFINGFIDREKRMESAKAYGKSPYGEHLRAVLEDRIIL